MSLLVEVSFQEPRVFDDNLLRVERVGGIHDDRLLPRLANRRPADSEVDVTKRSVELAELAELFYRC
jgi:hypothetical protein